MNQYHGWILLIVLPLMGVLIALYLWWRSLWEMD